MRGQKIDEPTVAWIVGLWWRAKKYGALPVAGGLLDQPERLMQAIDVIETEVEEAKEREAQLEAARNAARTRGGHHRVRR